MTNTPKLSDFKALLFDVDKTLTDSNRIVSPTVIAGLASLARQGFTLGLCTGRPFCSIRQLVISFFPENSLHVVSGGSQVINLHGDAQWEKLIPHAVAYEIAQKAEQFGVGFHIPTKELSYANDKILREYQGKNPLVPPMKHISELKDYTTTIIPTLDVNEEFLNYLDERDDITVKQMRAYDNILNADVTPRHINKATGLQEWCRLTKIKPEEIIGFGDSENDDEYLSIVGFSVAMGNATEYLKAHCDRVIGDTDDDGLGTYLNMLAEGGNL